MKTRVIAALLVLFICPVSVRADLQQLGDAWADVVTFGAWGQSRDLHEAEIAALKKHFEEETQRLTNQAEARVATALIDEKRLGALEAQYVGRQVLILISLSDVLIAQLKDEIAARYKINRNLTHFSNWFDGFVKGTNGNLDGLVGVIQTSTRLKGDDLNSVLKAARLSGIQRNKQIADAKVYFRDAMEASRWDGIQKSLVTVLKMRVILSELLEHERSTLRQKIVEMYAEDLKRRAICDLDTIAVTCDSSGGNCQYYDATGGQGPCGKFVFLNVFPVAFVKDIFDDVGSYRANTEFFVDLTRIGALGPVTRAAYRSPQEVFAKGLADRPLVPSEFRLPRTCYDLTALRKRLTEGIEYANMFATRDSLSKTVASRIAWLQDKKTLINFSLDGLSLVANNSTGCQGISVQTRSRLENLAVSVAAVESFGAAITLGQKDAEAENLFAPLEKIINEI